MKSNAKNPLPIARPATTFSGPLPAHAAPKTAAKSKLSQLYHEKRIAASATSATSTTLTSTSATSLNSSSSVAEIEYQQKYRSNPDFGGGSSGGGGGAISIDEKHTVMMNEFEEIEKERIPRLIAEKERICERIRGLHESRYDEYLELCDTLKQIKAEIRSLKKKKKSYLLDNATYIFHYFEEKKHMSQGATQTMGEKKKKCVQAFFKIQLDEESPRSEEPILGNDKYKNSRQYWANVNNEIINMHDYIVSTDVCEKCQRGELITQEDEGAFICNHCGAMAQFIVDNDKPTYKEPPGEVSYTAYIRLNHFKEILSQFQAKETTQIPEEVMDAIRARIKKERIQDLSEITYMKTRDILRKLGYNKYFEHIQYINCKFGIKPPTMGEELVEVLCILFIEIQSPWALHCPSTRTNFFNYAYTLYQLCRLVGADEYCSWIPLLKDPLKTMEQDEIWKKVCKELGWKFFPTPRN
jgi:hypothetical protein